MPTKLGKSHKTIDRATKKVSTIHPYSKNFSKTEVIEQYTAGNTRPREKQKIKSEGVGGHQREFWRICIRI